MSETKETILELVRELPTSEEIEAVMEGLYVRLKIERGLKDLQEGRIITHEEVREKYAL